MSRKPNSNSILKNLPQAKRQEVYERFQTTEWRELLTQLKAEGIDCGKTALYEFRRWYEEMRPILEAHGFAQRLADTLASDKGLDLDLGQINRIAQATFELQAIQQQNPELFANLQRLRVQQEANEIKRTNAEQKLREYEAKMAAAKAAIEGLASKGGISPETMAQIEEAARIL
jgi:L-rhamnose mutarotase